jgi:DNA-binding transcriptional LysR family regulator
LDPITLDQLRVFLTVVEEGSFSAAGRRLQRAQSAISYAISNLERFLELQLFDRATRTPTLTDAGKALLSDAKAVSLEFDRLRSHASKLAGGLEPSVSVAVDVLFPIDCLLTGLARFRHEFPDVEVVVHTEALGAVTKLVLDDVCQLAITGPHAAHAPGLNSREIGSVTLVPVVSSQHPLAKIRGKVSPAALQRHTQLVLTDRSSVTAGKDFGVLSQSTWRLADLGTKLACLKAGFGWGNMPLHMVEDHLKAGDLVHLNADPESHVLPMSLCRKANREVGPASQWLLNYLSENTPS